MVRSDLFFLICNYVHLGSEEYMTLVLMMALMPLAFSAPAGPIAGIEKIKFKKKKDIRKITTITTKKKDNVNRGIEE